MSYRCVFHHHFRKGHLEFVLDVAGCILQTQPDMSGRCSEGLQDVHLADIFDLGKNLVKVTVMVKSHQEA